MTLSELILSYRNNHDLSQGAFARKCGISQATISYLEIGVNPNNKKKVIPQMAQLEKLAAGMELELNELLDLCDDIPYSSRTRSAKDIALSYLKTASKEELFEFVNIALEKLKE